MKKPKEGSLLKVAESKEKVKELKDIAVNSFWNTCGEKQDGFPCSVCKHEKVGHAWNIDSPEHDNCFWEYVVDKSFSDGFMNPLSQAETAKLMGCSPTSVHMLEKSAIEKLKNSPYFHILQDFLTPELGDADQTEYIMEASYTDAEEQED